VPIENTVDVAAVGVVPNIGYVVADNCALVSNCKKFAGLIDE
jgi:hypothetical protein